MRVLIKGAGDLATGIACRLHRCGYEILMTDIAVPTAVRRTVAFSRAIYEGKAEVEGIMSVYAGSISAGDGVVEIRDAEGKDSGNGNSETRSETRDAIGSSVKEGPEVLVKKINDITGRGQVAVIVDEEARILPYFQPDIVVDAIIAKKNLGTGINDAPLVIGVGPGFTAGTDCHCVIETKRGHYLGKVMYSGSAIPNTGIPGDIGGYTTERIIRAGAEGHFVPVRQIGDRVEPGDVVARVEGAGEAAQAAEKGLNCDFPSAAGKDMIGVASQAAGNSPIDKEDSGCIYAAIPGIIRGLLQEGVQVYKGMKCGDIDPRCEQEHCYTVSDKARAIGGGALEAICRFERRRRGIGIVLLAAGEGKRYGSNKLLDVINGRRMFETTVDAAARAAGGGTSGSNREMTDSAAATGSSPQISGLAVVTGYDGIAEYAAGKGFVAVRNDRPELGISESLKLGLKALTDRSTNTGAADAVLFAVCDQPGLTADSFRRLIDGYAASDKGLACMGQGENILGNPCIFSKAYFEELNALTGDTGGKRIIMAHRDDLKVIYATDSELADIDIDPRKAGHVN